ncbi:MAG: sigma-70 family RNA polymerase sigma factor [Armatimonadota bacterium]
MVSSEASHQELLRLAKRQKDPRALDALIKVHTPLVKSIAARFRSSGEPFDDLVQEGLLGLLSAIELFDDSHGIRFTTYAHHLITGQIRHYLRDRGTLIRQPAWIQELRSKLERCRAELAEQLGREPTNAEIAAKAQVPEKRVEEVYALQRSTRVLRLDDVSSERDRPSVELERTPDRSPPSISLEDRVAVEESIAQLKPVEQKVIRHFFFQDMSQTEIARKLGVSCNYVSRILKAGLGKLRASLAAAGAVGLDQMLQSRLAQVEADAVLDAETGLYSRQYFTERLEEELIRGKRYGHNVAIVRVALAGLPSGPDGPQLLAAAAGLIKNTVRRVDIVCRFGDAEFGIIMPHTAFGAGAAANRIRDRFASSEDASLAALTIHTGIAVFPDQAISASVLIDLADPHQPQSL